MEASMLIQEPTPRIAAPPAVVPEQELPAAVFEAVTKRYDSTTALDGLNVVVRRGEILGLLGPNGSGKTTTVNLLCGLISPTSGTVTVLGHNVTRNSAALRPLLGVVPQETALYGELSAERNLRFHAELYGVPRAERTARVREMLELVGLWERRASQVKTLSGGMKRRLAIARAILHRPAILYLDEPTLGVDVASRRNIWSHIGALREQGTTILLTTNYLEEASELCDRIVIIDRGKAVAVGTPIELRRRFGGSVLDLTLSRIPPMALIESLRSTDGVVEVTVMGDEVSVTYTDGDATAAAVVNAVGAHASLVQISQRDASLDEVFLRLTTARDGD
jgi:daunorubicin resistance ABC transporter ATP-binding subunit